MRDEARVMIGDVVERLGELPEGSVQACVTSPPYFGLRDYGVAGQIGREPTPDAYVARLIEVFREVRRVLRDDGTLWINLGDCYASSPNKARATAAQSGKHSYLGGQPNQARVAGAGLKPKDLVGIPWMVAFALRADGWYLRQDVIWAKPNPMPESVRDRCTRSHEHVFMLTKRAVYFYDADAVREPWADERRGRDGGRAASERNRGGRTDGLTKPNGIDPSAHEGRNRRSVWWISPAHYAGAHYAVMPDRLAELCIRAGSRVGDVVLDPFAGTGTVGAAAVRLGRRAVLIDLDPRCEGLMRERLGALAAPLFEPACDTEPAA